MHAGGNINQPSIEYSLQSTSTDVCVTCTFLDSSTTDCVAVVHQRISQLSSSGLMNIESSHKLTRSGDTASGCIEGVNMEDYQVGVVGIRRLCTSDTTETKGKLINKINPIKFSSASIINDCLSLQI